MRISSLCWHNIFSLLPESNNNKKSAKAYLNSLTILGVNQRHFFSVRELKIREANAMELYRLQVTLQLYPGLHCDITKTWGVSTIYGHCKCAKLTEVVQ